MVFSSSGSGVFGKFEESNYASGKMSVIGLKNVLKLEGQRKGVRVNALVLGAITRMIQDLQQEREGKPKRVIPAVLHLCPEEALKWTDFKGRKRTILSH